MSKKILTLDNVPVINKKIGKVDTIEKLKKSTVFNYLDVVEVLGETEKGDGGHHLRKINKNNDGTGVFLDNGYYANLVKYSNTKERLSGVFESTTIKSPKTTYLQLKNDKYTVDSATRIYIEPAPKREKDTGKINESGNIIDGVGGCLKVFGDAFSEQTTDTYSYRDLGLYFHQNQQNDTGAFGNGVFWLNSKVLGDKYMPSGVLKNPDIGFSFQDGLIVAGRFTLRDFGASNLKSTLFLGHTSPKGESDGLFMGPLGRDNKILLETENDGGIVASWIGLKSEEAFQRVDKTDVPVGSVSKVLSSFTSGQKKYVSNTLIVDFDKDYYRIYNSLRVVKGLELDSVDHAATSNPSANNRSLIYITTGQNFTITNFDGNVKGKILVVIIRTTSIVTFSASGNLILQSSIETTNGDVLTFVGRGDKWYLLCKNNNATTLAISEKLDTPYYTLKMQQEGIYEEYVAYRDELHEYENSQTTEDTMLLPVLQEPVIPESVREFAEKYKLI